MHNVRFPTLRQKIVKGATSEQLCDEYGLDSLGSLSAIIDEIAPDKGKARQLHQRLKQNDKQAASKRK